MYFRACSTVWRSVTKVFDLIICRCRFELRIPRGLSQPVDGQIAFHVRHVLVVDLAPSTHPLIQDLDVVTNVLGAHVPQLLQEDVADNVRAPVAGSTEWRDHEP